MRRGEHGLRLSVEKLYYRFYHPHQRLNEDQLLDRAVMQHLALDMRVLDAGAGAGEQSPHDYRTRCSEVVGVDLDPRVASNPRLTQRTVAALEALPFPDACFHLVLSRWVFEHLPHPERVAREFGRVLKPGGRVVCITPNRYHYMTVVSALTSLGFHRRFNAHLGRAAEDVFPTRYRANTRRSLERLFGAAGFVVEELRQIECAPNYLVLHPATFLAGVLYERTVNRWGLLAGLRLILLGTFRKA